MGTVDMVDVSPDGTPIFLNDHSTGQLCRPHLYQRVWRCRRTLDALQTEALRSVVDGAMWISIEDMPCLGIFGLTGGA